MANASVNMREFSSHLPLNGLMYVALNTHVSDGQQPLVEEEQNPQEQECNAKAGQADADL